MVHSSQNVESATLSAIWRPSRLGRGQTEARSFTTCRYAVELSTLVAICRNLFDHRRHHHHHHSFHTAIAQVLKSLESCLHHYNTCLQLYNPSRYPRRWGLAALEMGMALGAMADLVERVGD